MADYEEPIMRDPDKQGSKLGGGLPPPGGGGTGPGGFGGTFGGGSFFGGNLTSPLGGESFGGSAMGRRKRRMVMGPNGPISVAASPMSTDTVPAMLTPGEGVLNLGAMQEPGVPQMMEMANQRGVQRMAEGGVVPEPMDKALLMKLLRLLLDDGDEMGEPQGYAFGGMVRPQGGGFVGARQNALGPPRMPAQPLGQSGVGQTPTSGGMFGGNVRRLLANRNPQLQPAGQTTGPSQWWPEGANPSGDPEIDLTPISGSGWDQSRLLNELYKWANQFGQAGAFSPEGNQRLLESLRGEATQNADALRRRSRLNADVQGLDAGQRGAYAMQSDLNTQGDVANILSGAQRGMLERQDDWAKGLLSQLGQFNMQDWLAERQGDISKRYAPDGPSGWETLASLGGAALGGWGSGGFKTPWGKPKAGG